MLGGRCAGAGCPVRRAVCGGAASRGGEVAHCSRGGVLGLLLPRRTELCCYTVKCELINICSFA